MPRMDAFEKPFFEPLWRRFLIVVVGLLVGLFVFAAGFAATGTILCGAAFWIGYELLVVFNVDTGRDTRGS